jgi:hypothetical protein
MEYPGSASCFSCSPGKFAPVPNSSKCEDCPRGYLQDQPKKSFCDKVKAGQVVAEGGSASIQVPLGSKICDDNSGCNSNSLFEACAAGKYGNLTPTNQCYDCEAGKSSSQGATNCQAWYVVNIFFFLLSFSPSFFVHEINPPSFFHFFSHVLPSFQSPPTATRENSTISLAKCVPSAHPASSKIKTTTQVFRA